MQSSDRLVSALKTWETARSIFRTGLKVEVFIEKDGLRDIWFPATIVEDLGKGLFLVEYQCSGANDDIEISRVTVDHHHVRLSTPQLKVSSFVLLEKVDAFYNFGWWSGVVTKKLADNKYIVYFKHTNKAKEFNHFDLRPHVEWKDDEWFTPYQVPVSDDVDSDVTNCETNSLKCSTESSVLIEETTLGSDNKTSLVATTMKKSKFRFGMKKKTIKPVKKLKSIITSDDQSQSNTGQSKEVSDPNIGQFGPIQESLNGDQTISIIKTLGNVKKKPFKRGKHASLKRSMNTSLKKKRKFPVSDNGPDDIPEGDTNCTTEIMNLDVVKDNNETKKFPFIPVVMGLPCNAMTVTRGKKRLLLSVEEAKTPQSVAPLSPKLTGDLNEVSDDGVTVLKKKRGRPFKVRPKNPKKSLAANNQNGDEDVIPLVNVDKMSNSESHSKKRRRPFKVGPKIRETSLAANNQNGDANTSSGMELTLQQHKSKTVKGKRGKRFKLISMRDESSLKDIQGPLNRTAYGNSEIVVENSLVTMSDDQPLSRWFGGKHSLTVKKPSDSIKCPVIMAGGDDQKSTFEKRSQLWGTLESMEAFRLIPQKPHFHPLNSLKESARERQAISYMVTFSSVFEDTFRLRIDNSRTDIEDLMDTLLELESHGFDVDRLRNRLVELLSIKDKQIKLDTLSKEIFDELQEKSVEDQENEQEIELIDKQINELLAKRDEFLKKKNKSELAVLEAELEGINESMRGARSRFDELASASL